MKKFLLLALLSVSMLPTYAQTSVGLIGGYNLVSIYPRNFEDQYPNSKYSFRSGWRAGLITDHRLSKKLYLQPQLLLNSKGRDYKVPYTQELPQELSSSIQLLYLELQANMVFKQQWGSGKFFVGAGPYIGRGIGGSEKRKGYVEINGAKTYFDAKYKAKFVNNRPIPEDERFAYFEPNDVGLNFQTGYELKNGLFFNAVYSLGFTNLYHSPADPNPKHTYFGLSVGYFFKKFS
jgi:hypothetical protein